MKRQTLINGTLALTLAGVFAGSAAAQSGLNNNSFTPSSSNKADTGQNKIQTPRRVEDDPAMRNTPPLVITLDKEPTGEILDTTIRKYSTNGHRVIVSRMDPNADPADLKNAKATIETSLQKLGSDFVVIYHPLRLTSGTEKKWEWPLGSTFYARDKNSGQTLRGDSLKDGPITFQTISDAVNSQDPDQKLELNL